MTSTNGGVRMRQQRRGNLLRTQEHRPARALGLIARCLSRRAAGPSWRGGYSAPPAMLTIQMTPKRSTSMPNTSPHICFSRGIVTVAPSESLSQ